MARYLRKDHLHQRAKREGKRSRAAYKLAEVQKAHRLLTRGQRVVDLGCWPGGWLEFAAEQVGPVGRAVGIDLAEIDPPLEAPNARALVGDLESPETVARLRAALEAERCDVLLSDAAPKLTGVRERDRANEERLLEAIEGLVAELLAPGGSLLVKILEGPEAQEIDRRLRRRFESAKPLKLASTRKGSTERFLLARGYRGPEPSPEA